MASESYAERFDLWIGELNCAADFGELCRACDDYAGADWPLQRSHELAAQRGATTHPPTGAELRALRDGLRGAGVTRLIACASPELNAVFAALARTGLPGVACTQETDCAHKAPPRGAEITCVCVEWSDPAPDKRRALIQARADYLLYYGDCEDWMSEDVNCVNCDVDERAALHEDDNCITPLMRESSWQVHANWTAIAGPFAVMDAAPAFQLGLLLMAPRQAPPEPLPVKTYTCHLTETRPGRYRAIVDVTATFVSLALQAATLLRPLVDVDVGVQLARLRLAPTHSWPVWRRAKITEGARTRFYLYTTAAATRTQIAESLTELRGALLAPATARAFAEAMLPDAAIVSASEMITATVAMTS